MPSFSEAEQPQMNTHAALFPTAYFPSIPLMAAMARAEVITIESNESFPKQTHRNRCVILTANGPMTLSVPVLRPNGTHTRTCDIGISYAEKWNVIHWRAIESAYNSSPFFLYYRDEIERILTSRHSSLLQLNEEILRFLLKKIRLERPIEYTTSYLKPGEIEQDFRDRYSYKHPENNPACPQYRQVFSDRHPFDCNVSILDTLFNLGPETKDYLSSISI